MIPLAFRTFLCTCTVPRKPSSRGARAPSAGAMDPPKFCLSGYDWVGFDLDNTLTEYNLKNLFDLQYNLMTDFLVRKRGYSEEFFPPLGVPIIDLISRGVILDIDAGNLLTVNKEGKIMSATHGTSELNLDRTVSHYGEGMRWDMTSKFCTDPLSVYDDPSKSKIYSFPDFSSTPASLVFALAVDMVDSLSPRKPSVYKVWSDVLDSIVEMYKPLEGSLYKNAAHRPHEFIHQRDENFIDWFKRLKESKKTFMITGSSHQEASFVAENSLGPRWKDLFDLIVYSAKKPAFFTRNNEFRDTKNQTVGELKLGLEYCCGNWPQLHRFITQTGGTKCVYFGDNILQDIYAAKMSPGLDTVAVIEELSAERLYPQFDPHPDPSYIVSHFWGSYLGKNFETVWGDLVVKHSKLCLPSLKELVKNPITHKYCPLWHILS